MKQKTPTMEMIRKFVRCLGCFHRKMMKDSHAMAWSIVCRELLAAFTSLMATAEAATSTGRRDAKKMYIELSQTADVDISEA